MGRATGEGLTAGCQRQCWASRRRGRMLRSFVQRVGSHPHPHTRTHPRTQPVPAGTHPAAPWPRAAITPGWPTWGRQDTRCAASPASWRSRGQREVRPGAGPRTHPGRPGLPPTESHEDSSPLHGQGKAVRAQACMRTSTAGRRLLRAAQPVCAPHSVSKKPALAGSGDSSAAGSLPALAAGDPGGEAVPDASQA